ncbi:hypothetical protein Tco_1529260, partial [Tanacetum coccineum]
DFSSKKDEVLDDIISIPPGNGNDHFNAESSLIESVLNRDNEISSTKIDFLIEEFAGELALIAPIPPGIVEADLDPKEDIRFIENSMYDNSFPRPPKTLKDDSKTVIDSNNDYFSSDDDSYENIEYVEASPPNLEIVSLEEVNDVDQEKEEFDLENILQIQDVILREKLSDFYHEEFAGELAHIISPPEYDCFYFKSEPDPGELTSIVNYGIRENVLSTINVNLPFEDDQSPLLAYVVWIFLSFLTICPDFEASRARSFVLRSLDLHILSFIWEIQYPNLID